MTTDIVRQSQAVLSTHARSFRWAQKFLPAEGRDDAAVVYAFCRLVDDLADEAADETVANVELNLVLDELDGRRDPRPLVSAFLEVAERRHMDVQSARELIEGVRTDLGEVCIQTDAELLRYCYRVAGTVGLMMCSILGVEDRAGHPHAIDLGVAMQLTNICRDVLEDAGRGRTYLPARRLREAGVEPEHVLDGTADRAAVAKVVRDLLQRAEEYYLSADYGMRFIPARSRLAIVVASRLYRAIGIKLWRKFGGDALRGRTWVTPIGKVALLGTSLLHFVRPRVLGFAQQHHDRDLHAPLRGLPGASA